MTSMPADTASGQHPGSSSIDLMPLAVLVLDSDLRAVEVSCGWEQLCGRTRHDSRGTLWWRSVDSRDRTSLRDALSSAEPSDDLQVEHRVVGQGGTRWTRWWWEHHGDRIWVCVADVDADRSSTHDLWRRATHDPLTGLANRTELMTLVERALERAADHPALAVVYVDLDRFKAVNDSSGHRAGDAVLAAVADAIVEAVRPFDVAARLGGDEFAVLCPGLTAEGEALALAGRIRAAVAASEAITDIAIGASVGVAVSRSGDSPDSLVDRADQAMYRDKAGRREVSLDGDAGRPRLALPRGGSDDEQLASVLVPLLFRIGLSLHAAADAADPPISSQLHDVIHDLDEVIGALRRSALTQVRRSIDGHSVRTAFRSLHAAMADAEDAVHRQWAKGAGASPTPADKEQSLRLVQSSRLLRAAERALEPDVLG